MTGTRTPRYREEEREQVVEYFLSLRKAQVQEFLERHGLPTSGTKAELRSRIEQALSDGEINYEILVQALDSVVPWGKQHVQLYRGPRRVPGSWKDPTWVATHLKKHRLHYLLNAPLPLILPESLRLSSIVHAAERLRITAVEKREVWERDESLDQTSRTKDDQDVALRAYVRHVSRGTFAFEWNLISNNGFLQISQLPAHWKYDDAVIRFQSLTATLLDLSQFSLVSVGPVIKKLHELEAHGNPEARSHNIDYRTVQGRRLAAQSATARDSVLGEPVIDEALSEIRKQGVGRIGNFYWLPGVQQGSSPNPLADDLHVVLVAEGHRVNFKTPSSEEVVRYVLQRVRALGA